MSEPAWRSHLTFWWLIVCVDTHLLFCFTLALGALVAARIMQTLTSSCASIPGQAVPGGMYVRSRDPKEWE